MTGTGKSVTALKDRGRRISAGAAAVALLLTATACTAEPMPAPTLNPAPAPAPAPSEHAPEFSSMAEAFTAVNRILSCDATPTTEPVVNPELVGSAASYRVCTEGLQLEFFGEQAARRSALAMYRISEAPLALVVGKNWLLADVSHAHGLTPTNRDLAALAGELNAEYLRITP